jgi:hypothetical protein
MLLSPAFVIAQSRWPSPLKSPVAIDVGMFPAGSVGRKAKLEIAVLMGFDGERN